MLNVMHGVEPCTSCESRRVLVSAAFVLALSNFATAGGSNPAFTSVRTLTSPSTASVGAISWRVFDGASQKEIDSGHKALQMRDIELVGESDGDFERWIHLNKGFYFKLDSGRETTAPIGFGIAAFQKNVGTFCWEWFNVDHPHHAYKIQETGSLGIDVEPIGDGWEIAHTKFLTDVSLRVSTLNEARGAGPKWRVLILKDSEIHWPTLVRNKVMSAREARNYLASHPPSPGFWESLVRTAEQKTSGTR